jgi:isopentenyldiphosphate isomerase
MIEYLEMWDWDKAKPTGKKVSRKDAHENSIPHEGVHLWIIRKIENDWEIIFQKRADFKDNYPGCLDISAAGHVPFDVKKNKIHKEAYEELGIELIDANLINLGLFRYEIMEEKYFHREFQQVYIYEDNRELSKYIFNDGEVTGVTAVSINNFIKLLNENFSFKAEYFNGSEIISNLISRGNFHPLLFSKSMENYIKILLKGIDEYITNRKVSVKMKP